MPTYIEVKDAKFMNQLAKFCLRVDTYSALLGLDAGEVATLKKGSDYFKAVLQNNIDAQNFAKAYTNFKKNLRYGRGKKPLGQALQSPVMRPVPAGFSQSNLQGLFAAMIQACVSSRNYSEAIGTDLGITLPHTPFNPAAGKPLLKQGKNEAERPILKWKKGKFDGIEIWIDRGDGWKFLDKDTIPHFMDKVSQMPASGQSAVWRYKAIYLYKGEPVGEWSEAVTVVVYGVL